MDEWERRMQTLEQVVLGVGTDNGMYRELKEMRLEMRRGFNQMDKRLDSTDAKITAEREARNAQWSGVYRQVAIWIIGLLGTAGIGVLVAVLT